MNILLAQVTTSFQTTTTNSTFPQALVLLIGCGAGLVAIAIGVGCLWLISDSLSKVPPEYRRDIQPWQVWLLLIPFFNYVWSFFVFQRIPDSFRAYFEATG